MSDRNLAAFNEFLYQSIPLVRLMQLELISCHDHKLTARAPTQPNLNDKHTIFGGSSQSLMIVCGWSLIKFNLEQRDFNNDVVIADAHCHWRRAQKNELLLTAQADIHWPSTIEQLKQGQQPKISVACQVDSVNQKRCTLMTGDYVILKSLSA